MEANDNLQSQLEEICRRFRIPGTIAGWQQLTSGHINTTYQVRCAHEGRQTAYLVQRVNTYVFRDPVQMMRNIDQLNYLQRPIMVAISRKGFGQKLFNLAKEDRLGVTLIAETAMYLRGGRVLRVHDVEETSQLVKMIDTIENSYWFRSTSSQSQRQ